MKIGVLIKTTAVDFPSILATSLFLKGCNLRCPYCYNKDLVTNQLPENEGVTFEEVVNHLEKRKNLKVDLLWLKNQNQKRKQLKEKHVKNK